MPCCCIIPGCYTADNLSIFLVPTNIDRRLKWLKAIRKAYPYLYVGKRSFVCKKHFRKTDFTSCPTDESGEIIREIPLKRNRLKQEAVPHFDLLTGDSDKDLTKEDKLRASTSYVSKPHEIIDTGSTTSKIGQEMHRCAFKNCKGRSKEVILHRFPLKDIEACKQWIIRSGNEKLIGYSLKQLSRKRVCGKHFSLRTRFEMNPRRLKPRAIPAGYTGFPPDFCLPPALTVFHQPGGPFVRNATTEQSESLHGCGSETEGKNTSYDVTKKPSEDDTTSAERTKLIDGLCQCCLATGMFLTIDTSRAFNDSVITCREVIKELFQLEIPTTDKTELICTECEEKLKDYYRFRYNLYKTQMTLQTSIRGKSIDSKNFDADEIMKTDPLIDESSTKTYQHYLNSNEGNIGSDSTKKEPTKITDSIKLNEHVGDESVNISGEENEKNEEIQSEMVIIKMEKFDDDANMELENYPFEKDVNIYKHKCSSGRLTKMDPLNIDNEVTINLFEDIGHQSGADIKTETLNDEISRDSKSDALNNPISSIEMDKIAFNESGLLNEIVLPIKSEPNNEIVLPIQCKPKESTGKIENQKKKTVTPLKKSIEKKKIMLLQVHNSTKIECSLCFSMINNVDIMDHMAQVHSLKVVSKMVPCKECNAKFKSEDLLLCHIKANHPFECDVCNRCFTLNVDLNKHKERFHNTNKI